MIQILEDNSPQTQRSAGLSQLLSGLNRGAQSLQQSLSDRQTRSSLADRFGEEFRNIRDPQSRNLMLKGSLENELLFNKKIGDLNALEESGRVINKYFGPDASELWPHLTEGGKTEFFKELMLGKQRGRQVKDIISEYVKANPEEVKTTPDNKSTETSNEFSGNEPRGISDKVEEELAKKEFEGSDKYLKEIREKYQRAQALKPVFSELRNTVQEGGTDALSWGNLADLGNKMGGFFGNTLSALGKANESGETGKFRALSKKLLDEMKDIFGGQIRVKELEVFLSMLPDIGKNREANLASIDVLEKMSQASTMFYDTAQEIIQKNNGKIPRNLAEQVQKQLKPVLTDLASNISKTTKSFDKKSSKKISKDVANQILKEAQGDKELARKIARERGYVF